MDNENKKDQFSEEEIWLDDILDKPASGKEIGPDEHAVSSAGLTHPDDLELERIMEEVRQSEQEPPAAEEPIVLPDEPTQQFIPPQEETPTVKTKEPAPESKPAPVSKGRPKPKESYGMFGIPHILSTVIWALLIIAIGVSLGRVIWVCCADVMAFGKESQEITITIAEGDDMDTISQKLSDAGLIRYPGLFKLFAQITGKDEDISAGTFTLNSHFDYNAMINAMGPHSVAREEVTVTFPDGYTCAQIFKLLEDKGVCSVADLESYAADGELDNYWFLDGVPRGTKYCLEGYLAPDTYNFYTNDDPRRVLEKFLDEFDDRFTDIMKQEFEDMQAWYANKLAANGYSSTYIEENKLTLHRLVTLASIVEKETANNEESYDIASVFYNRLVSTSFTTLGSDATVYYAIGDYFYEKGELTAEDLATDSPYNTRLSEGLPPGPISNPGVYSMYAVLDPNETGYYYFVLDPEAGEHLFSKTYSEHLNKVNRLGY